MDAKKQPTRRSLAFSPSQPRKKLKSLFNKTFAFQFVSRWEAKSHQGIAVDENYVYTSSGRGIYKYTKAGTLIASNPDARDGGGTIVGYGHINSLFIHNGLLYAGCSNYYPKDPGDPPRGYIKVYRCSDLSYVEEHRVGDEYSEGCAWHDGYWWVIYGDYCNFIDRYDPNWNFVERHPLPYPKSSVSYQGIVWVGDYVYLNNHKNDGGRTCNQTCDCYFWTGTEFTAVARLARPSTECTQDLALDPNGEIMWWAERNYPNIGTQQVVKSNFSTKIDVVMITKNSLHPCLRESLNSIFKNVPLHHLVVIDSFSVDGTIEEIKSRGEGAIKLIQRDCKRGEAREIGIKEVDTEWFAFVDSDVILTEKWFDNIRKYINPKVGAIEGNVKRRGKIQKVKPSGRGYTNCTLIRTDLVRDIRMPKEIHVFEDQFIRKHIENKGFKWLKVYEICSVHAHVKHRPRPTPRGLSRFQTTFEVGRMAGKYKLFPLWKDFFALFLIPVKYLRDGDSPGIYLYNLLGHMKGILDRWER